MPSGSNSSTSIVEPIEQARRLLDEALALAKGTRKGPAKAAVAAPKPRGTPRASVDFSMPLRAFVKKHVGNMSGAKKFTLLLAYLTKGDASKRVPLAEIEKNWNRMTAKGLLGMAFNRLYSSQARERDWVHAEKGGYYLRPNWKEIFE